MSRVRTGQSLFYKIDSSNSRIITYGGDNVNLNCKTLCDLRYLAQQRVALRNIVTNEFKNVEFKRNIEFYRIARQFA